jgi:hypothetical protein
VRKLFKYFIKLIFKLSLNLLDKAVQSTTGFFAKIEAAVGSTA